MENNIEKQPITNNSQFEQGEFSNTQQLSSEFSTPLQVQETLPPSKPKESIVKNIIIILVATLIIGFISLVVVEMITGKNFLFKHTGVEEEIKVNTGSEWGDRYLTYMLKNKPELTNYEISFIDFNNDDTPEMLLKYTDAAGEDTLRFLYTVDDKVYETKYYHNYKIRYIYSLKTKKTNWYIFIGIRGNYGSYTLIEKIIDKTAVGSDIKATNNNELIQYGKKYSDTEYSLVYYTINEKTSEEDYKTFISRYDNYVKKIEETNKKITEKYKDVEYIEEVKPELNTQKVTLGDKTYKFGHYYAEIPTNEEIEGETAAYKSVITLIDKNTIIVNGIEYDYEYSEEEQLLNLISNKTIVDQVNLGDSNTFIYKETEYKYQK